MLIYIGADHRGFKLKESLKNFLKSQEYEAVDIGNDKYDENDDYPDFAALVSRQVSQDLINRRGILICGSGAGVDIVANKFKGIRSVLAINAEQAQKSRSDDDTNILSLAADFISEEEAIKILDVWLKTPFSGEENYKRRIAKINKIEND
ncbi:MAG: RpiB/LacA/LacB family sugar-phosphate isomerase [Patescibacteria group bacterium]